MKRIVTLVCCAVFALLSGCGPLQSPMPPRLDDEDQKSINESWEKVLTPVDRYDDQSLLDIFTGTQAYEVGVDKLDFRSEKSFSGGVVVMEVHFDRLTPEKDRFDVKILNREGGVLRQASYTRKQVETTNHQLIEEHNTWKRKQAEGQASPEEIKRLEGFEARRALIEKVFPKIKDEQSGTDDARKGK